MKRCHPFALVALALGLSLLALSACGGGGGTSQPPPPPAPSIQAILFGLPSGKQPPAGFANALASVVDSANGNPITNATVTMNGTALTYNSAPNHQEFEGTVAVAPGDPITLAVQVGGSAYTASATQFTTYPTLTSPSAGDHWSTFSGSTVSWTGGAPLANALYMMGILDGTDPEGTAGSLQTFSTSTTLTSVPGGLAPGPWDVILGIIGQAPIAHASSDSAFIYGGFDVAAITVYQWNSRAYSGGPLTGVAWNGSQFVAVGLSGNNGLIYTSPDGITWVAQTVPGAAPSDLRDVNWSGTQFLAVGDNGTVLTSTNGSGWTRHNSSATLARVAWSGTQYVGVGPFGVIATSPDGGTWTAQTSGTSNDLQGITWTGTQFVAVGINGTILTSPNGTAWTARTSNTSNHLDAVAWSGGTLVAVGEQGTVVTSPDGITWTVHTPFAFNPIWNVVWTGNRFVAVGYAGGIWISPDGATWSAEPANIVNNLYSVADNGTRTVVVGDGYILTQP